MRRFNLMTHQSPDPTRMTVSDPDPASPHHAPVKTATEARAGVTLGTMRWVLTISLVAAVIVFAVAWLTQHA